MTNTINTKRRLTLSYGAILGVSLMAHGHSMAQSIAEPAPKPSALIDANRSDPFEKFNRVMWDFNYNYVDKYFARPVAITYRNNVPMAARTGLYQFATNFEEPSTALNNILQGNIEDSANAFARFLINSTVGVFGIFDVAQQIGLPKKEDEFGEVLAHYGLNSGPYIMLPMLGPTTIRNEVGDEVDKLYFPLVDLMFWQRLGIRVIKGIHKRAILLDQESILYSSLDPYAFVKEAYFQSSAFDIYDGNVPSVVPLSGELGSLEEDFDELDD